MLSNGPTTVPTTTNAAAKKLVATVQDVATTIGSNSVGSREGVLQPT